MGRRTLYLMSVVLVVTILLPVVSNAEQFKITVMEDKSGAAQKYLPVAQYLATKGIQVSFIPAKNYPAAAQMFASGAVDAMFSGSGIAGVFVIKELAVPLVRPIDTAGHSTYWATIIAPKGSPKFDGSAEYFKGKEVALTSLASSGEFYFRSLPGAPQANATLLKVASHGDALDAVNDRRADFAIVKNRIWDDYHGKYPNLTAVGEDRGENPDNTLIVSIRMPRALAAKVATALLAVENDASPEAQVLKKIMKIQGFIETTTKDFEHTLVLLKKAGATKSFDFAY